jgi:phosphate transport system substrate-binding protein
MYHISMKLKLSFIVALATSIIFIPTAQAGESLQGSGSSFASNFIDRCKSDYAKETGNSVSYNPVGSGSGKNMFTNNVVNFAMSDVPYSSSEIKPSKDFVYVPLVAGPIGIIYRLDGYKINIKLKKDTLANIFAGNISKWNDPQILEDNLIAGKIPNIPNKPIKLVYRSDGSGTSQVFTEYLHAIAPSIWVKQGNKSFASAFPGDISSNFMYQSASGSQGIAMIQAVTDGSISYNEISYARNLKMASIENESGKFMHPTLNAAAQFLSDATKDPSGIIKVNYLNQNKLSYNIGTFTYGIAYKGNTIENKSVQSFFNFMLNSCNKKAKEIGYSPITGSMLKFAKSKVSEINKI